MLEFFNRRIASAALLFRQNTAIAVIVSMMVLVPFLMGSSTSFRWHGIKAAGFEIGCVVLFCVLIARLRFDRGIGEWLKAVISKSPNNWLAGIVVWSIVSFALSPEKQFAGVAAFQIVGGALLYFCISQKVNSRAQFELILDAIVGISILGSLCGFAMYGSSSADQGGGMFVDHQLFGAFLMLMLPLTLVVGFMPTTPARRISAQVASVICASCLLLARTRASWAGEAVAVLSLAYLSYRYIDRRPRKSMSTGERRARLSSYVMPGLALISAIVTFVCLSNLGGNFSQRALSVGHAIDRQDGSFESRVQAWNGAIRMVAAKPLLGWGIGTYALHQQQFTHLGSPEWSVLRNGPSLSEQAHDFYLQTAAETGIIGLFLWIGFLTALFVRGFRKIGGLPRDSIRQRVLIGSLAALGGQVVDAFANPSWQFGDLMLFFWVLAGLSMAASGISHQRTVTSTGDEDFDRKLSPAGLLARRGFRVAAAGICGLALFGAIVDTTWALPAEAYCGTPCTYRCCSNSGCTIPCPAPCDFSCKSHTSCVVFSCGDSGHGYQPCSPTSCILTCPKGALTCTCSGNQITLGNPKTQCTATLTCTFSDGGQCTVTCDVGP